MRHPLLRSRATDGNHVLDVPEGILVKEWRDREIAVLYLSDNKKDIVAAEAYVPLGNGTRMHYESWFCEEALIELERHLNVS